jgi:hypothetical protein
MTKHGCGVEALDENVRLRLRSRSNNGVMRQNADRLSFEECGVSAACQSSEAGSEPAEPPVMPDADLAAGRAGGATGPLRRLAQGVPWRIATILLGVVLTIAWAWAIIWFLRLLLSIVV